MSIEKYKNIKEISDRELLEYLFSTQLQIIRRLDDIENTLLERKINQIPEVATEMVDKIPAFIDRINDAMAEYKKLNG